MAWFRADKEASSSSTSPSWPVLSARECAAAGVSTALETPRIIVTFGNDANARFKDTIEFDPQTLAFSKHDKAQNGSQTPVSAHSLASADGRFFYSFGGWDGSRDTNAINRYDSLERTWTSGFVVKGEAPTPRHFHSAVAVGRLVIVTFGFDGSAWTGDCYAFDTRTHRWHRIRPSSGSAGPDAANAALAPEARASHHAVALDDSRMALWAGFDGESFLSDLWILHVEEQTPQAGANDEDDKSDNDAFLRGQGHSQEGDRAKPQSRQDRDSSSDFPFTFRWERIERPVEAAGSSAWAEPRSGGSVVYHRNCLVVYGGRCRRDGRVSFSDRVEAYSFDLNKWVQVPSTGAVPAPRKCFAFAHVGSKLWVLGGLGQSTTYFADVHALDLDVTVALAFPELFATPSPLAYTPNAIASNDMTIGSLAGPIAVPPSTHAQDLFALVLTCFSHALPGIQSEALALTDERVAQVMRAQAALVQGGARRKAFLEALTAATSSSSTTGTGHSAQVLASIFGAGGQGSSGASAAGGACLVPVRDSSGRLVDGCMSTVVGDSRPNDATAARDGQAGPSTPHLGAAYTETDFQAYYLAAAAVGSSQSPASPQPGKGPAVAGVIGSATTGPAGGGGEEGDSAKDSRKEGPISPSGVSISGPRKRTTALSRRDHHFANPSLSSSSLPAVGSFKPGDHHSLVASAVNADLLVEIEDTETATTHTIPLHRGILASRCPFFATLLSERWHPASPTLASSAALAAPATTATATGSTSSSTGSLLAGGGGGGVHHIPSFDLHLAETSNYYSHSHASPTGEGAAAGLTQASIGPAAANARPTAPAGPIPTVRLGEMSLLSFFQMVHYIYTDCLPLYPAPKAVRHGQAPAGGAPRPLPLFDVGEHGLELLAQAGKFDLQRLSLLMQACLEVFIGEDTVCSILQAADSLEAVALRASAMRFILAHFDKVTAHPSFVALPEQLLREVLVRRSKAIQPHLAVAAANVNPATLSAAATSSPRQPGFLSMSRQPSMSAGSVTSLSPSSTVASARDSIAAGQGGLLSPSLFAAAAAAAGASGTAASAIRATSGGDLLARPPPIPIQAVAAYGSAGGAVGAGAGVARAVGAGVVRGNAGGGGSPMLSGASYTPTATASAGVDVQLRLASARGPAVNTAAELGQQAMGGSAIGGGVPGFPPDPPPTSTVLGRQQQASLHHHHHQQRQGQGQASGHGGHGGGEFEFEDEGDDDIDNYDEGDDHGDYSGQYQQAGHEHDHQGDEDAEPSGE